MSIEELAQCQNQLLTNHHKLMMQLSILLLSLPQNYIHWLIRDYNPLTNTLYIPTQISSQLLPSFIHQSQPDGHNHSFYTVRTISHYSVSLSYLFNSTSTRWSDYNFNQTVGLPTLNQRRADAIYMLLILFTLINYIFNILVLQWSWVQPVGQNCCFVQGETFCYIIHSFLFSSICFYPYISNHAQTGSCDSLQCSYSKVFEWKCWDRLGLTAPLIKAWNTYPIDYYITWLYDPSKYYTHTKPMVHMNMLAFLWSLSLTIVFC